MSEHQLYHALGGNHTQSLDRRRQTSQPQSLVPGTPSVYPSEGTQPGQYGYGPSQPAGSTPWPYQEQHGTHDANHPGDSRVEGLATQMGSLGLSDGSAPGPSRGPRKKNRHAYHNLSAPGSSQVYGAPSYLGQPTTPATQPLGVPTPSGTGPISPYTDSAGPSTLITPAADSFGPPASASDGHAAWGLQGTSPQGRVDPDQIPSVPRSRDRAASYYLDHVFPTLENHLPPPGAVPFVAHDQGNSSPRFARLTTNSIPSTVESLASTGLPLGLLLQPLASLQPGETPIPVLDFGESGPPRCRRCRAYVNPFMTFRSGGNRFVCNMCNFANEVATDYFSPLNPQGVRIDREQRPELMRGTVEFMVPKEYWAKEPVGLRILFVIDVGQEAINRAFLEGFCQGILAALYDQEDTSANVANGETNDDDISRRSLPPGAKVGIMTYDKEVHFYSLSVGVHLVLGGN